MTAPRQGGPQRIVVAYDGSSGADIALNDMIRAGLSAEAEAVIVTAANISLPPEGEMGRLLEPAGLSPTAIRARSRAFRFLDQAQERALQGRDRLRALFPGWVVHSEARGDSPAWAVVRKADDWNADLIVTGSHGRTGMARLFLGSVSTQIVNEARCSVRIGRPWHQAGGPIRLLIGYDGSADARAAMDAVLARTWPRGTEALVVTAADDMIETAVERVTGADSRWVTDAGAEDDQHAWVRHLGEAAAGRLSRAGIPATAEIVPGDPKSVLPERADAWGADTVFVGARGLNRVERFLIGSVPAAIVARLHCSIEVIRPPIP